ncbi:hypothetical protein MNBD_GAMMA04-130 [hydrothermal vent metagenome]|uniref:Uncharacterized protein n=1 Tax=hydrothermal vent metagenome TaxID=652676 RepID=A0A3B0W3U5_9ZZZZ
MVSFPVSAWEHTILDGVDVFELVSLDEGAIKSGVDGVKSTLVISCDKSDYVNGIAVGIKFEGSMELLPSLDVATNKYVPSKHSMFFSKSPNNTLSGNIDTLISYKSIRIAVGSAIVGELRSTMAFVIKVDGHPFAFYTHKFSSDVGGKLLKACRFL